MGEEPATTTLGQHHETTILDNNMGKQDWQQNGTISWDNSTGLDIEQQYLDKKRDNDMEY